MTEKKIIAVLGSSLGLEVRCNAGTPKAYRGCGSPGAEDLSNMFQVEAARGLNPSLQSFEVWLAENKSRIPTE